MTSRNAIAIGLMGFLLGAPLGLSGCKKAPPPPPPPPPKRELPPPPPPPVNFDALIAELKIDKRVSVASNVEVLDPAFAKAALKLADAFAKGDDKAAGAIMARRAKSVLDDLVAGGGWAASTKNIEAVRIVFAAPPIGGVDTDRAGAVAQLLKDNERTLAELKRDLERQGTSAEEIQKRVGALAEVLATAAESSKFETSSDALADRPQQVMLMAVQDQSGAYLLGWGGVPSGDSWLFNNAATMPGIRPRASQWDGIGLLGFSLGTGQAADSAGGAAPTPAPASPAGGGGGGQPPKPGAG